VDTDGRVVTKAFLDVWVHVIASRPASNTEDSWHAAWDGPTVTVVRYFGFSHDRNTSYNTSTGIQRPDGAIYLRNQALIRFEEKSRVGDKSPHDELTEKSKWTYDELPFIFGWAAEGSTITLYILYYDQAQQRVLKDHIHKYDILLGDDRLELSFAVINMLRLCQHLLSTLKHPEETEIPVDSTLTSTDGRKVLLRHSKNCVTKKFFCTKSFGKNQSDKLRTVLKHVYSIIEKNDVPNTDRSYKTKGWRWIHAERAGPSYLRCSFQPIMYQCDPQYYKSEVDKLMQIIEDILTALVHLHENKIIHRDIRWPNIMVKRLEEKETFCLIDFEDAYIVGYKGSQYLRQLGTNNHHPQVNDTPCDYVVDTWGVAHLLETAGNKEFAYVKGWAFGRSNVAEEMLGGIKGIV